MILNEHLKNTKLVFWDFDGVIKDSVAVKTKVFTKLFASYGPDVVAKVRRHHEAHGGVSRFIKIPHYFREYLGIELSDSKIEEQCNAFAAMVMGEVIASAWVPGVEDYLRTNPHQQRFVLVTGTPQNEMEQILNALSLGSVFESVHGAPKEKTDAVRQILQEAGISPEETLFLGDAFTDFQAANANHVPFLLRDTPLNKALQVEHGLAVFSDFLELVDERKDELNKASVLSIRVRD